MLHGAREVMWPFACSFILPSVHLLARSVPRLFFRSFVCSSVPSFGRSVGQSFVRSLVLLSVRSLFLSFVRSFVRSFFRSLVRWFGRSVGSRSFVPLFGRFIHFVYLTLDFLNKYCGCDDGINSGENLFFFFSFLYFMSDVIIPISCKWYTLHFFFFY